MSIAQINAELIALGCDPLNAEQIAAIANPAQKIDVRGMLDMLVDRIGVSPAAVADVYPSLQFSRADCKTIFANLSDAERAAEEFSESFDAAAIIEHPADSRDGRDNEYSIAVFSGIDAAIAAAEAQDAGYFVDGEQH